MPSEVLHLVSVGPNSILPQQQSVPTLVRMLEQDAPGNPAYPAGLIEAVRAGEPLDLLAPRSLEAAEHDGESPNVAGYLRALIRDYHMLHMSADLDEFNALGAVGAAIRDAA